MLDVAAAFGGGLLLKNALENAPTIQRRMPNGGESFKLSVRAVAAAAPALAEPGVWSQQRPRLQCSLGDAQKETELADFEGAGGRAGAMCARECPWRFGDTLTFMVSLKDVTAGPGLRVKLRAQSDITLGLVQFQMSREAEIGEACVDLQRRVLPGCCDRRILRGVEVWESPVQLVPLGHVRGGVVSNDQGLGQAVAHVALSFSVDCDPEKILSAIEADAKSVTDVLHDRAERAMNEAGAATERAMRWLNDGLSAPLEGLAGYVPGSSISDAEGSPARGYPAGGARSAALTTITPQERELASKRASDRGGRVPLARTPLLDPTEEPDGWVKRKGPNGRWYFHNLALGPAPWEENPDEDRSQALLASPAAGPSGGDVDGAQLERPFAHASSTSFGPIVSPDLPMEGWTCYRKPDGRTFWHHTALGPVPWASLPPGTTPVASPGPGAREK